MTKAKASASAPKFDYDEEVQAIESKGLRKGVHVAVHMGNATRRGKVTAVEMGDEEHGKPPMIQFDGHNKDGEKKTYRHRPSLCDLE